jgi:DNA-binding transcriptional MerR regulator
MPEYFTPISELAKKLDVPAHTLRYWEKEFPTLIAPTTGAGGRRYYRGEIVANAVALKKYLYADGYTIDGVKKLAANGQFLAEPQAAAPAPVPTPRPVRKKSDLQTAIGLLKEAREILDDN